MAETNKETEQGKSPRHIAIIMDGNGRWAKARYLPRMAGHRAGTENIRRVVHACIDFKVEYLTIYAFSTENWKRPKDEVDGLLQLLGEMLDREVVQLHKDGVCIRHIGRLEHLNDILKRKIADAVELTKNNTTLFLNIAWNYGGRDEIVYACQNLLRDGIAPEAMTEELFSQYLYTKGTPDPDLMIRTSGEFRTSNFLIWQSAYSEWYISDVYWPDFDKESLRQAIESFTKRERRYGGRNSEDAKQQYAG
ncbi:isoprenyl transferase [Pelolinea submarina]|uniref:Isoprenyl transferase n=1 Tax=Pelolinea submarina TaxID=913107 RepID=A0A347ZNF5_9CHLR|nr:isoprenyl transferase [Pelolinea submarina]REG08438.1 undecaprenyl diphosphate synthase [Pelolinea submarina]BBB46836.1 undecaprenyl diphosphate synthase [Pelolinea submarina]